MKARIPEGSRYGSADGTDVLVAGTLNAAAFANAAAQAYPLTLRHKGTYVHHSCVLPVMVAMPFLLFTGIPKSSRTWLCTMLKTIRPNR
jgi:hypothetical protein